MDSSERGATPDGGHTEEYATRLRLTRSASPQFLA